MVQVFQDAFPMVPVWAGVCVNGGAIAGKGKVFLWDNAAFDGREDGEEAAMVQPVYHP